MFGDHFLTFFYWKTCQKKISSQWFFEPKLLTTCNGESASMDQEQAGADLCRALLSLKNLPKKKISPKEVLLKILDKKNLLKNFWQKNFAEKFWTKKDFAEKFGTEKEFFQQIFFLANFFAEILFS